MFFFKKSFCKRKNQEEATMLLDFQVCRFSLIAMDPTSGGGSDNVLRNMSWAATNEKYLQASNLDYNYITIEYKNLTNRVAHAQMIISLNRKYTGHVFEIIVPTGVLVALSWVRINGMIFYNDF